MTDAATTITDPPPGTSGRPALSRREFVMLLSMLMALTALGIDAMLPAFEDMRASMGLASGSPEISRSVTAYFLGLAIAQLLFGPLSDRYGRRPVMFMGIAIYALGAVGAAISPSLGVLLVTRFLWGFGAAAGRVVVMAVVRDSFVGDAMASLMSTIMAVFLLVPIIAPSLGSAILLVADWRAIFWFCAVYSLFVGLWAYLRLPESLAVEDRKPIRFDVLRTSFRRVFTQRETLLPVLGVTVLTSVFTSYLGSAELIIGEIFDRESRFALIFGATAAVFGASSLLNGRLVDRFGMFRLMRPVAIVYLLCALGMLALAVANDGRPPFWFYYPLLAALFGSSMILNPNMNALALVPLGDIAGTASAVVGAVSLAAGALLGAVLDSQLDGSITPFSVAVVLSGLLTVLLAFRFRASPDQADSRATS